MLEHGSVRRSDFNAWVRKFAKFSIFDVFLCCADSDEESVVSEIDVSNERERRAQKWFFRPCVRLKDAQTFSDLLNAHTTKLDTFISTASVITWAFADTAGLNTKDSGCVHVYREALRALCKAPWTGLKRVLPENPMTDASEIIWVTFKEVHPAPSNDQIFHPSIKKFLNEPLWIHSPLTKESGRINVIWAHTTYTNRKNSYRDTVWAGNSSTIPRQEVGNFIVKNLTIWTESKLATRWAAASSSTKDIFWASWIVVL